MKTIILYLSIILTLFAFDSSAQIKIVSNGDVGMGLNTPTPIYKLDIVSGESRFSNFRITHWGIDPRLCGPSKITFYRLDGTGYANIGCRVNYEYSDSTAKENIADLGEKCLETVKLLKGASYNWKNDKKNALQSGFLAQDLEKAIPEAVITNDSTKQKSIAYSFVLPYLVEATKELEIQINKLKIEAELLEYKYNNNATKSLISNSSVRQAKEQTYSCNTSSTQTVDKAQINCFIPERASSSLLYIYNKKGTQLQQHAINGKGNQTITLANKSLEPGLYFYSLVVDGNELNTKRIILTK